MWYGSTAEEGKLAPAAETPKEWEWESRGWSFYLFVMIMAQLARQMAALVLVVFEVVWRYDYLLSCNPYTLGYPAANLCEYSKAYVRCFPLLAMVVSIMVADRLYLYQRLYYQLLKRHGLIIFDRFKPFQDPLFLILLFSFSQALIHFAMMLAHDWGINGGNIKDQGMTVAQDEAFQNQVNSISIFFIVPGALFLALLYAAYDISEMVLPFNKYFEEDVDAAMLSMRTKMVPIHEATAMKVLQEFEIPSDATDDEVYQAFIEQAKNTPKPEGGLSSWRLVSTWWPAKLLLNRQMKGEDSAVFKLWWYALSLPSSGLIFFIIYCNFRVVHEKFLDCAEGQLNTDLVALVIVTLYAVAICGWTWTFTSKTLLYPVGQFIGIGK